MTGWISPVFVKSLPVPGVEPTAPGAVCIQVHPDWIPYIAGALDVFRQAAVWAGTAAEIETATRQAGNLLDLIASATNCPTGGEDTALDYILIRDEKSLNTSGGSAVAGAWQTRNLTEKPVDTGSYATLDTHQIILSAGTYEARITAPAYRVARHKARLQDITHTVTLLWGTSEHTANADAIMTTSRIAGRFTLASSSVLEVQHWCQTAVSSTGLGVASNIGIDEVYTVVELWRVGD